MYIYAKYDVSLIYYLYLSTIWLSEFIEIHGFVFSIRYFIFIKLKLIFINYFDQILIFRFDSNCYDLISNINVDASASFIRRQEDQSPLKLEILELYQRLDLNLLITYVNGEEKYREKTCTPETGKIQRYV